MSSLFAGVGTLASPNDPLVSSDDFAEWYGLTPSASDLNRIQTALEIASAQIRNGRRDFSQVIGEVEAVDVAAGAQSVMTSRYHIPVTAVSLVEEFNGAAYVTVDAAVYQWTSDGVIQRIGWQCWRSGVAAVRVTYSHGYAILPRDVAGVCLSLAGRLYTNPDNSAIQSEQLGDHHVTYQGASGGLSSEETSVLRAYESIA